MTASDPPPDRGHAGGQLHRFAVQRIPPSHDYIRSHGSGPKDSWAKGPADPGSPPAGPGTHPEVGPDPVDPKAPAYGDIHKFGYTRPLKKHQQPPSGDVASIAAPSAGEDSGRGESPDPSPFVHLHVHSNFSFLDGGSRIEELVARAAELGQPALALTDHDGLYGAVRFAKACTKRGIKPIFGAEVRAESLVPAAGGSDHAEAAMPEDPHHLVLLAEDREGYANLCRLLSTAHLAIPERDRPPLVTIDSLRHYSEGLICLTGCRHGEVGYLVDAGRDDEARSVLLALRDIFGPDHLFVELQYFGYEPHREAHAGQDGVAVYKKIPGDDKRIHHRFLSAVVLQSTELRKRCTATAVASSKTIGAPDYPLASPTKPSPKRRSDLPQGQPQRLNPSDYDVGFHRDRRAWRLSCLTYCLHLTRLAADCNLPTILTNDAHYAGPSDLAVHLICRAAGHDKPLSGYPNPAPGARCLRAKVELETEAAPLLEQVPTVTAGPLDGVMLYSGFAIEVASTEGVGGSFEGSARPVSPSLPPPVPAPVSVSHRAMFPLAAPRAGADYGPLGNTWAVAQRCSVDLELDQYHFPKVDVPRGETAYSLLAKRCFRGIARMYKPVPPRAVELLEKELRMIQQMDFAHYFLVVHDIVRWARAQGVACSGRGSAGNSIVCHALDITASEPIRHNLLFERFLNPNRREMPDIDVDFCSSRRDEVIDHIYQTFGSENVAVVANVNTMSPRSAVRIVAEALGFAPTEINALAKHVPRHGDAARIREYLAGAWPELRDSPLQDEGRYARFLDLVERLDSFPMHLGTHLGGFVIADRPITYYAPLKWRPKGCQGLTPCRQDVIGAREPRTQGAFVAALRARPRTTDRSAQRRLGGRGVSPRRPPKGWW